MGYGDLVRRISYVGMIIVGREQYTKASFDIATREVGRITLVRLEFPTTKKQNKSKTNSTTEQPITLLLFLPLSRQYTTT